MYEFSFERYMNSMENFANIIATTGYNPTAQAEVVKDNVERV